jgi:hypothetical protein
VAAAGAEVLVVAPRLMASAAAAVAISAVTVGCGTSADLSSVAKAASKTENVKTLRFSIAVEQKGEADAAGEGALDFAAESGTLKMTAEGEGTFEVIWNGATTYVKNAGLGAAFGNGKPWVRIRADNSGLSDFARLAIFDPSRQFALLEKAGHFRADGAETVRGTQTTKYAGEVDTQKFVDEFLSALPEDERPDSVAPGSFPVTAWIDGEGLLRRVVYDFPEMGPDDPAGRLSLELYDFGGPVDVTPPPSDQVTEMPSPKLPTSTGNFTMTLGG